MTFAALAAALTLFIVALAPAGASATTSATCPGGLIPRSHIGVTAVDTTSGSNKTVSGFDMFSVKATLSDLDGMAAGCKATIKLPNQFQDIQNRTLYLNSDGNYTTTEQANTVAVMVVKGTKPASVTFTLTDYASTHTNVSAYGYATAQINATIKRGKKQTLTGRINGKTTPITVIHGKTCKDNCPAPPPKMQKQGVEYANGTGFVTIDTQVIPKTGTKVTVTDTLTDRSHNEKITSFGWWGGYDCVGTWGNFGVWVGKVCDTKKHMAVDQWCPKSSVSKNGQSFKCTITTRVPHEFIQIGLNMKFSGKGPWADQGGDSYSGGKRQNVRYKVESYKIGGGASGVQNVTKTFEIDTDHMTTQACATKVFNSLTLPNFQYGALDWTWTTTYGQSCFTGHYQILTVTLPKHADSAKWIAAINKKITAPGVGKVRSTAPLTALHAGTTTMAFFVPANGWLKGRPSTDRAPHVYFASSE